MTYDPFLTREWCLAHGRSILLGPFGVLMGVLNVTPDSFSDGGLHIDVDRALARGEEMVAQGAKIIDVGGESTRPGAEPVDAETEQARILPVIEGLAARGFIVSVDTYRASTAHAAIQAGAHIVNDVSGEQTAIMLATIKRTGAGLVMMHNYRVSRQALGARADTLMWFMNALKVLRQMEIGPDRVVLDPGVGFGKDMKDNLEALNRISELHQLNHHLLLGTSRKRFLGEITKREAADRDAATAATTAIARRDGVAIFRVHALEPNRDAVQVADAIRHGYAL